MSLHIYLFDHLRITDGADGSPRALRSRAQRLLVFLLLHRRRPLTREQIAFTLWPDGPEHWALGMLRRALSDLRAALAAPDCGECVVSTDTSLHWNANATAWLDIEAFEQAIIQATPSALHHAVELYTGDLLAGWDDEWIVAERERLRQLQVATLRELVTHHRALGGYEAALTFARRALVHDPLAEAAHRDLIAVLYAAGDRSAALTAYDHLSALLVEELGVEPMAATQALRAAIIDGRSLPLDMDQVDVVASPISVEPALPTLVGRDTEMEMLSSLWKSAESGSGRLMTVSGDAGVGKSHLVRALTDTVAARRGLPLVGHCYEFEQALPYQAIVEMLRSVAPLLRHSDLPAAHRSSLARLAPDVLAATGTPDASADLLITDPRAQLFEALWQAFLTLARSQPLLLVVEDMHWAAESVIDWLTYIAPHLDTARILIVPTWRTDEIEAGRPLARLNRRLARVASVATLSVLPLSPEAHRELVVRLSGLAEVVASPLADRLFEETAGNPFFLHEIVRELIETAQLVIHQGQWEGAFVDGATSAELPLPDSVRELISARAERLDPASRTFIQVAAVAGRIFQYGAVQHAIGWTDEPALHALEDVLARGFVAQHDGEEDFAFAHHLIQEVVYAGMTVPRRVFWHRRMAGALQSLRPDDVEALAHHLSRAGDDDQARIYYARAGDRARQLAALDDAASYYHAALDRWPAADHAGRAELLYKRGQCQWVLSELHAALDTFDEARALFEMFGNWLRVGDIERMVGRVYWEQNDREASLKHYHRALVMLQREPESVELAHAISAIAQMHMMASEFDDAISWGERALALAERLGAEEVAIHALINLGCTYGSFRDDTRGLAMLRDSLSRAQDAGLAYDAMRAAFGLAEQFLCLGRYAEAQETYDGLLAYSQRVHSDVFTGIALRSLVQLMWLTGRWAAALAYRRQLIDWVRIRSRDHVATVWANRILGVLYNDLGQADRACRLLERDLPAARSAAELQTTAPHLAELARAHGILGNADGAAELFQEVLTWVDHFPFVVFDCAMPLLAACQWFATHSDPINLSAVQACVARLQRTDDQVGSVETRAALAEARGLALIAEGAPAHAVKQFHLAVRDWEALVRPFDHARALGALGNALERAGQLSAASKALDRALTISDMLAAQITSGLKTSFLNSSQVRELRMARSRLDRHG